jgi:hypothetical protein
MRATVVTDGPGARLATGHAIDVVVRAGAGTHQDNNR